jgi:hypothetical protein
VDFWKCFQYGGYCQSRTVAFPLSCNDEDPWKRLLTLKPPSDSLLSAQMYPSRRIMKVRKPHLSRSTQ